MPRRRDDRPTAFNTPEVNTTRRSWQKGGLHFTMETTSYSTSAKDSPSRRASAPNRTSFQTLGGGLFGTAFGLMDNLLASQQRLRQQQPHRRASERWTSSRRYVEDQASSDEEEEEEELESTSDEEEQAPPGRRGGGVFANTHHRTEQRARAFPRRASPLRRGSAQSPTRRRSNSCERDERRSRWDPDVEDDDSDGSRASSASSTFSSPTTARIQTLENIAERERTEIQRCKRRREEASRRGVSGAGLQGLLAELQSHEGNYARAMRDLQRLKARPRTSTTPQYRAPRQDARPSTQRRSSRAGGGTFSATFGSHAHFQDFGNPFHPSPDFDDFPGFPSFGGPSSTTFEHLFNDMGFGGARSSGARKSTFTSGARPQPNFSGQRMPQMPRNANPNPTPSKPQPPVNLLKPGEAKQLFHTYNQRWTALAPTDPNVPYPCRGLQSRGLVARDTIWAPQLTLPVASWSEDAVMQANAQAFYLGAVGLIPTYTASKGTITMGYDKARASAEQARQLVDVLKKEKARWHSDRLGRRNGGGSNGGTNEALQRDEKARAVFHACVELMEFTQQ